MNSTEIKKIISDATMKMFTDSFYELLANKITDSFYGKEKNGYVYFIQVKDKIKIGMAISIIDRLKSFKTLLGNNIQFHGYIYNQDYKNIEKEIHEKLKNYKIHGEWFGIDLKLIADIIDEYNGVQISLEIDNSLIIEDGVFISGKKINQIINNEIDILEKIYLWMQQRNYKIADLSVKEIKEYIFDNKIEMYMIRRAIERKYSPSNNRRYNSIIDNTSKVGRTYRFEL
jgi:hypothetical protein